MYIRIIGASEAKPRPSLLGGAKPEDLVCHGSRGTSCPLHVWLVGWLVGGSLDRLA